MVRFLLNDREIESDKPTGYLLLDLIRYDLAQTGTKIGCREGDCGACTVLVGELNNQNVEYKQITSCLTPIGNINGKHVVTIEGISTGKLSPVQLAMIEESGTQCGFCTPGFVVSLTAHCLQSIHSDNDNILSSIDGNICRCTGYKSIERAAEKINTFLNKSKKEKSLQWLINNDVVPEYFHNIPKRLDSIKSKIENVPSKAKVIVGGGTDLYVQRPFELVEQNIIAEYPGNIPKGINMDDKQCVIGAGASVTDLKNSSRLKEIFPSLDSYLDLVSSTPIRNISTIAGNFVNASPIGDFTIFFLALNARISLKLGSEKREILLKDLYRGYKDLTMQKDEIIWEISFDIPSNPILFNFEKVSKRRNLDIASVNSAASFILDEEIIINASISAGGVSPIPLYLRRTSNYLISKKLAAETIMEASKILQDEISPISDARGSQGYKSMLLRQLFFCHFLEIFPDKFKFEDFHEKY